MSLPPLAALRAFEAAARHLSFKKAATELAVTPTAISHQIRLLEETLGLRLFDRAPRQVQLTNAGQELFPVLRDGFHEFSRVIEHLKRRKAQRSLTVSVLPSFAAKWLLPRLPRFQVAHPDIHLSLHTSVDVVDLAANSVDAAIRYGAGPYPGLIVQPLFFEHFAPMASPVLNVQTPDDLRKTPLLHLKWLHSDAMTPTWARWFDAARIRDADLTMGLAFSDDTHAIQAAIAGHGVVLASFEMTVQERQSGLLEQPFGPQIRGYQYHLLHSGKGARQAEIQAFGEWVAAEIAHDKDR
ncbi:transcriptional regulator GcvA [Thalassospira sp.]|uniref:transcriptional regulator GcvA n=1 Tax=Thalassospira sp. TaxID=1912094 RepID=UPI003AA919EF